MVSMIPESRRPTSDQRPTTNEEESIASDDKGATAVARTPEYLNTGRESTLTPERPSSRPPRNLNARLQGLESGLERIVERLQAAEARLESLARSQADVEAQQEQARGRRDAILQAWQSAPLQLRLTFAQGLLHEDHAYQPALKEALALEDLRRRGRDLEAWMTNYPALFADAVARLDAVEEADGASEALAAATLHEAHETLDACLQAMGLEWISPRPGEAVTRDHEVVGEEVGDTEGRVARRCRLGFRWQGRLYLHAQVLRTVRKKDEGGRMKDELQAFSPFREMIEEDQSNRPSRPTTDEESSVNSKNARSALHPFTASPVHPLWLQALQRRAVGTTDPDLARLIDDLAALLDAEPAESASDRTLQTLLDPLLPLMGSRRADVSETCADAFGEIRLEWETWLGETFGITVVSPAVGDRFDSATMEAIATRRTAHVHEDGTVARVERIGLQRNGQPLVRARVLRYEMGDRA